MNLLDFSLAIFTILAVVWDLLTRRIPNYLCIAGCAYGLLLQLALNGWEGLVRGGAGATTGLTLSLLLYAIGAIGAGDVKWFAAAGAIASTQSIAVILVLSVFVSGAAGACLFVCRPFFRRQFYNAVITGWFLARFPGAVEFRHWRESANVRFPYMLSVLAAVVLIVSGVVPPI